MSTIPAAPPPAEPVPSVPYGPAGSAPVAGAPDAVPASMGRTALSTGKSILIRTAVVFIIRAIFRALFRR